MNSVASRGTVLGQPRCGNCHASARSGDGSLSCRLGPPQTHAQFVQDEKTGKIEMASLVSVWPSVPEDGRCYEHKSRPPGGIER